MFIKIPPLHFHAMKTRQHAHDNRIIKQVIGPCSFSAQKHLVMLTDKLRCIHASLQKDIINQGHMHKTAHTCTSRPIIQHLFAENTEYTMLTENQKHPQVLSDTHTPDSCWAESNSLTVCFIQQKPETLQQLLTQRPSICSSQEAGHQNFHPLSFPETDSRPQPEKIPCYVAPSSGDGSRLQMKSSMKSVSLCTQLVYNNRVKLISFLINYL